ncbi:PAS domain-containing sensor histidine kinase [Qipengyuania seohaensis]|uniref:PAS domain-containing sensor histidine kinase n=1 Tax=Qipengyuania seohaensis TaxID=266951 RepID=UPI000C22CFA2|nr:PAS domain-containing sensor histidine kinase [Qipengyuania seohaensis]
MDTETQDRHGLTWQVTPDLLGVLNDSGLFEATNPAWEATLGYASSEIENRRFFDFIHPEDVQRTQDAFEAIQQGEPILNFRNRYRHKSGEYRWLSWNCVPERGKFYCSARDVTEAVDDRTALRSSEDEAALREQFIAVLGHDLRNPLAALKSGYALLAKEELSARGQTVIGHGTVTLNRMSRLIDDLMDFARTRLGSGLSLDITSGERLEVAIRGVIQEIRIVNPDVSIQSEILLTDPVPCDVARVSQLLSNLIANAVTHGDISSVISVRAYENADELLLEVENGGDQIEPAAMAKLFEPFVREEIRPSQEGLGLGLFIASQIAQSHGGKLAVNSDPQSTIFTFRMPRE